MGTGSSVPSIAGMKRLSGNKPKWSMELQIHPAWKASLKFALIALHRKKAHAVAPRKKNRDVLTLARSGIDTPIPIIPITKQIAATTLGKCCVIGSSFTERQRQLSPIRGRDLNRRVGIRIGEVNQLTTGLGLSSPACSARWLSSRPQSVWQSSPPLPDVDVL